MHPYLLVLGATVMWGVSGVYVKILNLPLFYFASLRTLIPVVLIFGWTLWQKSTLKIHHHHGVIWIASLLNAIRTICFFIGYTYLPVSQAVVLMYTWPIWVVLLESLMFNIRLEYRQIALTCLAFAGILIVQGVGTSSFGLTSSVGGIALLVAALANAGMLLLFKKANVHLSAVQTIFYQNIVGSLVFLPFFPTIMTVPAWKTSVAIAYAAFVGIGGYLLFFLALQKLRSSRASLLSYFEVITNVFFASLLLHEPISRHALVGGGLIVISAILMYYTKEHPQAP